jgi:hypothetical protein
VGRHAAHPHRPTLALSTVHGDLLWRDGRWPGSRHEQELLALSAVGEGWTPLAWPAFGSGRGQEFSTEFHPVYSV